MRNLTLCLILLPLFAFAQKREVFRIDSLPKEGVLLNQGWKWHAGDDPEWAKAEFDDASWEDIDPTKDIVDEVPEIPKPYGICWFRLHLRMNSELQQKTLSFSASQSGASELYANGVRIWHFGVISSDPEKIQAFDPANKPIPYFNPDSTLVLAIRYTLQPKVKYTNILLRKNPVFSIRFNYLDSAQYQYKKIHTRLSNIVHFRLGVFVILLIGYLSLYTFYPSRIAYLYFSLFALFEVITDISQLIGIEPTKVSNIYYLLLTSVGLYSIGTFCILTALYALIGQKRTWLYWSLFGLVALSIVSQALIYHNTIVIELIVPNFINIEIVRITLKSVKVRTKGALIIATGGISFTVFWTAFIFLVFTNGLDISIFNSFYTIGDIVYNLAVLSIPIAVSIYSGYEVALNNRFLGQKLSEVETLSAEKQQILAAQNETLEQQVTERTAELSTKNRELEIEAALERVRSRTMAMQRSDELADCTQLLFHQIQGLEIPFFTCGFTFVEESLGIQRGWTVSPDGKLIPDFIDFPLTGDEVLDQRYESWKLKNPLHIADIHGEANKAHHQFLASKVPSSFSDDIIAHLPDRIIFYSANFSQGNILILATEFLKAEEEQILIRFAKVFEQTYTRFLDLQKAEARAVETARNAALDRVRGEIASMRTTHDLQRITPVVWRELTTLGVPFFRCGVFIMDEANQTIHSYLSTPEGKSLAVMHLPFDGADTTQKTVDHWRRQEVYTDFWDKEQFVDWVHSMAEQGYVREEKFYQGGEEPPETLSLHFVPFTQGMLYVGSAKSLEKDQISLVKTLADAFAVAYARYEDFSKLEEAKNQVELTLIELKATQNQLIQSEKLASLGELTAGIAHEIQNPLNFVNNFAEVSAEMIDELKEELEKGDIEEVKAIAEDLQVNLGKINHHGGRASSIVKGMLEHSRTSTGVKEPTYLNALADEYLRLAYHGLRAKDSSFNATMETHFEPDLPKVSVIPQDIGRVLLNLINNAFYAVSEKAKQGIEGYSPTVTLGTKKLEEAIEITIQDNGNGIPESIRDKIFQPFFTTKPTGQGTGLGLSLAYDIVTKGHGGTLTFGQSSNGTLFEIKLPLS